MKQTVGWALLGGLCVLLVAGVAVGWYYDPARALERDWERLLGAVEERRWECVEELLSPHYSDVWGQDRAQAIERADEALRLFLRVKFAPIAMEADAEEASDSPVMWEMNEPGLATQKVRLEMSATGGGLAVQLVRRFNELPGAFSIRWQRMPGWPPRWQVLAVDHDGARSWGW